MKLTNKVKSVFKSRKVPSSPTQERLTKPSATKLDKGTLEQMLKKTYEKTQEGSAVNSYVEDKELSDRRSRVFYDPKTKHTVVAHRGSASAQDWAENAMYAFGFRGGRNYKHARGVQRAAEEKYGTENLTTIGHSKGALHAQDFGQKGDIVTLNKPVNIKDALAYKVPKYQTDYRGEGDVVSVLRPLQKGKKEITLTKEKSTKSRVKKALLHPFSSLLKEHSTDTLSRKEI
jgi:hypothetical protein